MSTAGSPKDYKCVTLTGANYHKWAPQMKNLLRMNGCWGVVDGTVNDMSDDFVTMNNKALGFIGYFIAEHLQHVLAHKDTEGYDDIRTRTITVSVLREDGNPESRRIIEQYKERVVGHDTTSQEVWFHLKETYGQPGAMGAYVEFQKLVAMRFVDGKDMREQIGKMDEQRIKLQAAGITLPQHVIALMMIVAMPPSFENLTETLLLAA